MCLLLCCRHSGIFKNNNDELEVELKGRVRIRWGRRENGVVVPGRGGGDERSRERLGRVLKAKLTLDFVLWINGFHTWSPLFK